MTSIKIHPAAAREVRDGARWYEGQAALGDAFSHELERVLGRIAERPESFPPWTVNAAFRKARAQRFPYVVFFRIVGGVSQVMAVAHAKRRPGYWLERAR